MNTMKPMKMNNAPLGDFDQNKLKEIITNQVTMMLAANLDRWLPEVGTDQCERNVNSARTTAACIAQRVLTFINSTGGQLRPRDLKGFLLRATADAEFVLVAGDTEETIRIGENPSFGIAVADCADRIIVDLVLEPA